MHFCRSKDFEHIKDSFNCNLWNWGLNYEENEFVQKKIIKTELWIKIYKSHFNQPEWVTPASRSTSRTAFLFPVPLKLDSNPKIKCRKFPVSNESFFRTLFLFFITFFVLKISSLFFTYFDPLIRVGWKVHCLGSHYIYKDSNLLAPFSAFLNSMWLIHLCIDKNPLYKWNLYLLFNHFCLKMRMKNDLDFFLNPFMQERISKK